MSCQLKYHIFHDKRINVQNTPKSKFVFLIVCFFPSLTYHRKINTASHWSVWYRAECCHYSIDHFRVILVMIIALIGSEIYQLIIEHKATPLSPDI